MDVHEKMIEFQLLGAETVYLKGFSTMASNVLGSERLLEPCIKMEIVVLLKCWILCNRF